MKRCSQITMMWSCVARDCVERIERYRASLGVDAEVFVQIRNQIQDVDVEHILIRLPLVARSFNMFLASGDESLLEHLDLGSFESFAVVLRAVARLVSEDVVLLQTGAIDPTRIDMVAECIKQTRQVLGLYARLTYETRPGSELPYHGKTDEESLCEFHARVEEVPSIRYLGRWSSVGKVLFHNFDPILDLEDDDLVFKHGPGVVAERWIKHPCDKERGIKAGSDDPVLAYAPVGLWRAPFTALTDPPAMNEPPLAEASHVSLVPKDHRGKRIIAAEPVCHQFLQQGVAARLTRAVLHSFPLSLAVDLARPELNQERAQYASLRNELATVDLSDASDTVRVRHIEDMLSTLPRVRDLLLNVRTRWVQSSLRTSEITTAFPMGSALCFPVETAVYAWIAITAISAQDPFARQPVTKKLIAEIIRDSKLRVYGDDIIVHQKYAPLVVEALTLAGMKPNRLKCCLNTLFKESCGGDYYGGRNVVALRPRALPGSSEVTADGLIQQAGNFANEGYLNAACFLWYLASSRTHYPVPVLRTDSTSPGCIHSDYLYWASDQCMHTYLDHDIQCRRLAVPLKKERLVGQHSDRRLREVLMRPSSAAPVAREPFRGWPLDGPESYRLGSVVCAGVTPYTLSMSLVDLLLGHEAVLHGVRLARRWLDEKALRLPLKRLRRRWRQSLGLDANRAGSPGHAKD